MKCFGSHSEFCLELKQKILFICLMKLVSQINISDFWLLQSKDWRRELTKQKPHNGAGYSLKSCNI